MMCVSVVSATRPFAVDAVRSQFGLPRRKPLTRMGLGAGPALAFARALAGRDDTLSVVASSPGSPNSGHHS
jgi:hypothetical protein